MLIQFLNAQFENGASYSTLNSIQSVFSLIFSIEKIHKEFLKRFLKGIYNKRPSKPKYHSTWDPHPVLMYLSSLHPLQSISLSHLTFKLVTLLALITGHRIQTLSKIKIQNIQAFEDRLEIRIPDTIKTSKIKNYQPLLVLPFFRENLNLCVASTLNAYLSRTQDIRPPNEDQLILTYKRPIHAASTQRISKWIKIVLQSSGVDVSFFSSYSTRHAATSAAYRSGVNIENIRRAAGWTDKSNMFNKFYNRPLAPDSCAFARGVLGALV